MHLKDAETRKEFKRFVAEYDTVDSAIKAVIELWKARPDVFRPKIVE